MPDIARIIYIPTLACNCRCEHCGQERRLQEPECDCELVERRILESRRFENGEFVITGGEPFLKKGLPAMLARLCNSKRYYIGITTNGICTEEITEFCDLAAETIQSRAYFSVSIDGMPEVHNHIRRNPMAFEKAVQTVKTLKSKGIPMQVNTVIQRKNYDSLDHFAAYMEELCEGVKIVWIPEIASLAGKRFFPYTEEERKTVLQRIEKQEDAIGKLYLEKHGDVRITNCHAGQRTFAVSPDGKLYTCITGLSYMGMENRDRYYIGDLREHSLDELFELCLDEKAPSRIAVAKCEGCWNNCEVGNELNFWDQSLDQYDSGWRETEMKDENLEISVEQIMKEIRAQVYEEDGNQICNKDGLQDSRVVSTVEVASDSPVRTEEEAAFCLPAGSLLYLNQNYDVPYYWSFGPHSIKTFAKRVVRKLLKCLIPPILALQNKLNANIIHCLNQAHQLFAMAFARIGQSESEIALLRQELQGQMRQLTAQEEKMAEQMARQAERITTQEAQLTGQTARISEQEVRLAKQAEKLAEQEAQLTAYETQIAVQAAEMQAQQSAVNNLEDQLRELRETLSRELSAALADSAGRIAQCEAQLEVRSREISEKIERIDRQSDAFSASVAKTILAYKRKQELPLDRPAVQPANAAADTPKEDAYTVLDYFQFQNHFRGSRALIAERQSMYLPYFENCAEPVVDIGCGRGEFLRILKEARVPAFGVDLYPEYLIEGELNDLDIRQGDGIAFLKNTDQRFGGIFAAQLIEHISFAQLQELCQAAFEKLVPGGYLILETPNPTCLAVYTHSFYIDPTHQKPVHPLLLTYVLQQIGFRDVQTVYTEASRTGESLPRIDGDGIRNLEEVNQAIGRVSELLYGSQDYAVIAKK